jgi:Skp family chaperone for outer membrane proteins
MQELQQQLQEEFQRRVAPIIEAVGKEKNLHFIFNGPDSGLVYGDASLDITAEVIKKFDAMSKPAAAKPQGQ